MLWDLFEMSYTSVTYFENHIYLTNLFILGGGGGSLR